ncbi:MAG: GNAT family N-acetyltransferase [Rivularia sp. ALOHA_DT_140]|nr:GNAT family N-acetyltransferase [Rivularia sp. ALOHA_DT_140]
MKLHRFEDANLFYQKVEDYLLKDEVLHNLLLGATKNLINYPQRCKMKPYLAIVEQDENIIAVAMMTIPYNLLLSQAKSSKAIDIILQDLQQKYESLTNVNAPVIESEVFAKKWCLSTGQSYQLRALRIFKLERVEFPSQVKGNLRLATENDKKLLISWHGAFNLEALGKQRNDLYSESCVDRILQKNTAYLWNSEIPVSIACSTRSTRNGIGINMVYTPPEYRKRGYAGACVAALSQILLDKGYKFCFLFTDLSNPTSNKIYQKIGYQPVADWNNYRFSD